MGKDKKAANREYAEAKAELERITKRDRAETDAYLAANDRVAAAAKSVSWWRR